MEMIGTFFKPDMCNFLADLQDRKPGILFTGKDMFDMWKKQTLEYYTSKPVTHKEIERLDFETRIRKRDELLTQKFSITNRNSIITVSRGQIS